VLASLNILPRTEGAVRPMSSTGHKRLRHNVIVIAACHGSLVYLGDCYGSGPISGLRSERVPLGSWALF